MATVQTAARVGEPSYPTLDAAMATAAVAAARATWALHHGEVHGLQQRVMELQAWRAQEENHWLRTVHLGGLATTANDDDDLLGAPPAAAVPLLPPPGLVPFAPPPGLSMPPPADQSASCGPGEFLEWRIACMQQKLCGTLGRPLVLKPLEARGALKLRLLVCPGTDGSSSPGRREYRKMVNQGPLHGALKLKATDLGASPVLTFNLTLGRERRGPFTHDFEEQALFGCMDFEQDWLLQLEEDGAVAVGVELLGRAAPTAAAAAA